MEPEYIILISAGGVFVLLLLTYLIVALRSAKIQRRNQEILCESYSNEKLQKMEYDVAFYESNVFFDYNRDEERQVTIDDVLTQNEDRSRLAEQAVFASVEDENEEIVVGRYNPSK